MDRRVAHIFLHDHALAMLNELGAITLSLPHRDFGTRRFQFAPGADYSAFLAAADDADLDAKQIIGPLAFPVGEGDGSVLFIGAGGCSALINNALCGYARATDPFILLSWFLLGEQSDAIEQASVPFGERITGRRFI